MISTANRRRIIAGALFAVFAVWAAAVVRITVYQGDSMIGSHPLILGMLPAMIVGIFAAVTLLIWREWLFGAAAGVGSLAMVLVFFNGAAIENHAWRRAIELHAAANGAAMANIKTHLAADDIFNIWDDGKLDSVQGFLWFGSNRISAPDGIYRGFRIAGVPHVRIQKIRNGWRGIALIHSDAEFELLKAKSKLDYKKIGAGGWVVWSL